MSEKPGSSGEPHPALKGLFDALGAGKFDSIDDVNAFMERQVAAYNSRPQADLGGLSPDQMYRLSAGDWMTSGALRLNAGLSLADLGAASFFHDARTLLEYLRDEGPVKLTAAGNLPRKAVKALLPRLQTWSAEAMPGDPAGMIPVNEGELRWLPVIRYVLKIAKLVMGRAELKVNRRGLAMLEGGSAGALYALLFQTLFREVDLRAVDGFRGHVGLQATIPYSLYMLRSRAKEWASPEKLAQAAWHPDAKDPLNDWERERGTDFRHFVFQGRVLRPLEEFGLLEERALPGKEKWDRPVEMRKTLLFDRFLSFAL